MDYSIVSKVKINENVEMPLFGLGTWLSKGKECEKAVQWALEAGYIHIDTASYYKNEEEVGKGLRKSGVDRDEVFITTKLWNNEHGYENCLNAIEKSLERLQVDYVDLYLIHWPVSGKRIETWKAMQKIQEKGLARAIGVSNYMTFHLEELYNALENNEEVYIPPAVDQVEANPFMFRKDLYEMCLEKGIQFEAYSPLARTKKFDNPKIVNLSEKYGKSPAQIMIRWCLQKDIVVIPKSINKERIKENSEVFDFTLSQEDMMILNDLNEDFSVIIWDPQNDELFR